MRARSEPRPRDPPRRGRAVARRLVPVLLLAAALGMAACGDDQDGAAPTAVGGDGGSTAPPPPADGRARDRAADAPAEAEGGSAPGSEQAEDGDAAPPAPAGCAFAPPPGRLAVDELRIDTHGVGCTEARALAKAAALGQPAGANLTIERHGFGCEPSTSRRGVNVTYECVRGGARVEFEVRWSDDG